MEDIEKIAHKIRNLINEPRKQNLLLKNVEFWNQLCSSLDVTEDTETALESYLEKDFPQDDGKKYLVVYGVLQALYVQQDAVENLVESLNLPKSHLSSLNMIKDIREIRNKSIGHPTKKEKRQKPKSYHFISRITMSKEGFQLVSDFPDKRTEFTDVNTIELIKRQKEAIKEVLKKVYDDLKKEELEHKEQFKNEKLIDVFSDC